MRNKQSVDWKALNEEVKSLTKDPFPNVVKDSRGNKWCCISPTICILMTGIYKKGKEPSAEIFTKEQFTICNNAINGEIYMNSLKNEEKKRW